MRFNPTDDTLQIKNPSSHISLQGGKIKSMINTETVLMQVQSQQIPPTWRVYRGKKTFFMREAAIYSFLFLLVMALVVYLYSDPFLSITYGPFLSNTADTQTFLMTRTIDFVVP